MTVATLAAGQHPFSDLAAVQPPEFTLGGAGLIPVSSVYQPQQSRDSTNVLVQLNGLNGLYYPAVGQMADASRNSLPSQQQQQQQLIQQQILLQHQQQQQQQQLLLSAALARPAFGIGANFAAPTTPQQLQPAATAASFEGMPIFIVPQSGTLSLNALQRANEFKLAQLANSLVSSTPKIDTSKHFHVFVGDLSSEVDNNMLKEAFDCCGTISEAKVIRDPQSLKSRGYGFVSFPEKKDAQRAIDEMNGATVGRRAVRTNWASRRAAAGSVAGCASDDEKGAAGGAFTEVDAAALDRLMAATDADNTTVYVGNLANSAEGDGDREEELREAFKQFGDIKEIRLFLAQNYGFVVFERKRSAAHAILALNGTELRAYAGRRLRCSWGRAGLGSNASGAGVVSQHDTTSLSALATAQLIAAQYAASQSNQNITAAAQNANALLAAQMSAISHQQHHQQQQQQQMAAVAAAYAAAAAASGAQPPAFDALAGQMLQGAWPS